MADDHDALRRKLAAIEHGRWADWQCWLHDMCTPHPDGSLTIPAELVERWERQIATSYAELSEAEQRSDMEQVDRYWPLILAELDAARDIENRYWDRCADGENPDSVAADMPEMARTHRNVSALTKAHVQAEHDLAAARKVCKQWQTRAEGAASLLETAVRERDEALEREARLKAALTASLPRARASAKRLTGLHEATEALEDHLPSLPEAPLA
jgi:hypothetical protein